MTILFHHRPTKYIRPENSTHINWGDEITSTSTVPNENFGATTGNVTEHTYIGLAVLSKDGSRRIIRSRIMVVSNVGTAYPDPTYIYQIWENMRTYALSLIDEPGQKVHMIGSQYHTAEAIKGRPLVGKYLPYTVVENTEPVDDPVNLIPAALEYKKNLANMAHGLDISWNGRYMYENRATRKFISELVCGLIVHGFEKIDGWVNASTPALNDNWKTTETLMDSFMQKICNTCTKDIIVWPRILIRKCNMFLFRIMLDNAQIPSVNTITTPWSPGEILNKKVLDTSLAYKEKKKVVDAWHDSNYYKAESIVLAYYDDLKYKPEKTYGYNMDHDHFKPGSSHSHTHGLIYYDPLHLYDPHE